MAILDVRPALRIFLLGSGSITNIAGDRIYPLRIPQGGVHPSIVYQKVSDIGDHHNTGPSGLASPRFQIASWAQTADEADALGRAVKARLDGHVGTMGTGANEITVRGIFFDGERHVYDDETKFFGVLQDYFIWFAEF